MVSPGKDAERSFYLFWFYTLFTRPGRYLYQFYQPNTKNNRLDSIGNPIPNVGYGDIFWKDRPLLLKK